MKFDKILVTGGSGFIGSHVVENLVSRSIGNIRIYDIDTSLATELFGGNREVEIVRGDICDKETLSDSAKGCDAIIHLAAMLGVDNTDSHPYETLKTNLEATVNLMEMARDMKTKRFIFASSSEVYGEPSSIPIKENDPKSPVSVYGISKLAAESYCSAFNSKFGLKATVLRYCNVYGPRQGFEWVVPMFIKNVLENKSPIIFGDGSQSRSFIFVNDAAEATALALESESAAGSSFNIGNMNEVTIKELASMVIDLSGKIGMKPEYRGFGNGTREIEREVRRRIPDTHKAKKILGWNPKTGLEEGLRITMDWYKENL